MRKLLAVVVLGLLLVAVGYAVTGVWTQKGQPAPSVVKPPETRPTGAQPAQGQGVSEALASIQRAADAKKFLFLFVYDQDNESTREARKKFEAAIEKVGDTARWTAVDRSASSESEFVAQFELKAVPTPFILTLAPNGAITGGFQAAYLTEQKLMNAVVSPAQQACMKALQERKLIFVCVQNAATKANDLAMKGVDEFKADARFAQATEIVTVDPSDGAEKKFLGQLQLASDIDQATTVLLAPPGSIVAKIPGATTKDALVVALQKASSGCSGASGCCPAKK